MIDCPECRQAIEEQIPACPHCGSRVFVEHPADMNVKHRPLAPPPESLGTRMLRVVSDILASK